MGIHDKHCLYILRQMLSATVKMPDGTFMKPDRGTSQGGIISPLLANIVLNELDHWIDSQWQNSPVKQKYSKCNGYIPMRKTGLKEMYIVRYADDFRIFCRNKTDAERTRIAVTQWLTERLKLEVPPEKTRVINFKSRYSMFSGFKAKVHPKGQKQVVKSHINDKQLRHAQEKLVKQAKRIGDPRNGRKVQEEISLFNSMVMGIQNYYRIATNVDLDCSALHRAVMKTLTNRLRTENGSNLVKSGRMLSQVERKLFGKFKTLRYVAETDEPVYPIGYVQPRYPMTPKRSICQYTTDGRKALHDNLRLNVALKHQLMRQPLLGKSAEYADNRISLFSAQWGKCAVTGKEFTCAADIHCHHKILRKNGGTDKYENLVSVLEPVHKLIHATQADTIQRYMDVLHLDKEKVKKLNLLREKAGLFPLI